MFTVSNNVNSSPQQNVPTTLIVYASSFVFNRNTVSQGNIFPLCTALLFF
jgi:hypothetical protein